MSFEDLILSARLFQMEKKKNEQPLQTQNMSFSFNSSLWYSFYVKKGNMAKVRVPCPTISRCSFVSN